MLGLVIIKPVSYIRYKPTIQKGGQFKDLNHCLQWHGLKAKLGTDPVVQHLSLVMARKGHGVQTRWRRVLCVQIQV